MKLDFLESEHPSLAHYPVIRRVYLTVRVGFGAMMQEQTETVPARQMMRQVGASARDAGVDHASATELGPANARRRCVRHCYGRRLFARRGGSMQVPIGAS